MYVDETRSFLESKQYPRTDCGKQTGYNLVDKYSIGYRYHDNYLTKTFHINYLERPITNINFVERLDRKKCSFPKRVLYIAGLLLTTTGIQVHLSQGLNHSVDLFSNSW